MRARPRRRALGLRGRIVGAVLVTTVVTLGVAALALLPRLEQQLRGAELKTLKGEVTRSTPVSFAQLDPGDILLYQLKPGRFIAPGVKPTGPKAKQEQALYDTGKRAYEKILGAESTLQQEIDASDVVLLGLPDRTGRLSGPRVAWPPNSSLARSDPYADAVQALLTGNAEYSIGSIGGTDYARAAIPFLTPNPGSKNPSHWVLVVRKRLDEVSAAVAAVRNAFFVAALAGLALTLVLAFPLAGRLVRRLRRLREAAVRLAAEGPSVEVPVDRVRDEVGDLARTFAVMQERLLQQEEARRAFVATASHELRTPLTSLEGMLELLEDDLRAGQPDVDESLDLLERARAQSRRLGRLAVDLLDLSRLDAQVSLRSEPVELGELSRAVLAEFDLGLDERQITTEIDDSAGSVWALGDPGSVARILRILLDNAVRVSPDHSEIRIELRNGSRASLSVRDHGPGVAEDERELIFERFKRGRDTMGRAGFGLGLAIGRELAERMGGELVLERGEMPGATFSMHLPAAEAPHIEPLAVG
jgi:signal transduction histidine kinase